MQLIKQDFCLSWDSNQPRRFTQEETSRKPELKLKQTRSSTPENQPYQITQEYLTSNQGPIPAQPIPPLPAAAFVLSLGFNFRPTFTLGKQEAPNRNQA